jgi:hypothetical protein
MPMPALVSSTTMPSYDKMFLHQAQSAVVHHGYQTERQPVLKPKTRHNFLFETTFVLLDFTLLTKSVLLSVRMSIAFP